RGVHRVDHPARNGDRRPPPVVSGSAGAVAVGVHRLRGDDDRPAVPAGAAPAADRGARRRAASARDDLPDDRDLLPAPHDLHHRVPPVGAPQPSLAGGEGPGAGTGRLGDMSRTSSVVPPWRGRRTRAVLAGSGLVLCGVAVVACGGDGEAALASKESNVRSGSAESGGGSDPDSEYCTAVRALQGPDAADLDDPAAAIAALAALGDVAPEELKSSFEVLSGVVEDLAGMDPD